MPEPSQPEPPRRASLFGQAGARDMLVALVVGLAVLASYSALGGKLDIVIRLGLWRAAWRHWAAQEFAAPPKALPDFRLKRSPFLDFTTKDGIRYHPLIDFAGAQFPGARPSYENRDFFGFRNGFNAYFAPCDCGYIVMTGNSELVGVTHERTIAQDLEAILNARSPKNYRVLNLGLNHATSSNEINFFVNLAFNLHPAFVISHSFVTTMRDGDKVPPELQELGMFYPDFETLWIRLHNAASYDPEGPERLHGPPSERYLLEGFLRDLRRYRAIAEGSGARFIFGLQKFDASHAKETPSEADWARVRRMYEKFKTLLDKRELDVDVIDFNSYADVRLVSASDPMHTTNASARKIAEIYADHILALEGNR